MKLFILLLVFITLTNGAPTPEPNPSPIPGPKANPSLLLPTNTAIITTNPVVSYSHSFKAPLYPAYQPYVYNLGYASGYSYNAYPYFVPLHYI